MYSTELLTLVLFLLLLSSSAQERGGKKQTSKGEKDRATDNAESLVQDTGNESEDDSVNDNSECTGKIGEDESGSSNSNSGDEENMDDDDDDAADEGGDISEEANLKQFHEDQLEGGHVISQKERCNEIGRVVRKTIFPEIKFANSEKFFDYQPVRDGKDGSVGMLFRRIRSKVATVGADEESWWISMKKPVKDALQKKRGTVCQAIKMTILGKLTCVPAGIYQLAANTSFCLLCKFYYEIKLNGRKTRQACQA